jgi:hypothetical protein
LFKITAAQLKRERAFWLAPSYGEILADVEYFWQRSTNLPDGETQRDARAAVVFSVSAIEAVTNDALTTVYDLLVDTWPSECRNVPPWIYFQHFNSRHVAQLITKAPVETKSDAILSWIRRSIGSAPTADLKNRIHTAVIIRNRIVHMASLSTPNRTQSVLHPRQIKYTADVALGAAQDYVRFVSESFNQMNLVIESITSYAQERSIRP